MAARAGYLKTACGATIFCLTNGVGLHHYFNEGLLYGPGCEASQNCVRHVPSLDSREENPGTPDPVRRRCSGAHLDGGRHREG